MIILKINFILKFFHYLNISNIEPKYPLKAYAPDDCFIDRVFVPLITLSLTITESKNVP